MQYKERKSFLYISGRYSFAFIVPYRIFVDQVLATSVYIFFFDPYLWVPIKMLNWLAALRIVSKTHSKFTSTFYYLYILVFYARKTGGHFLGIGPGDYLFLASFWRRGFDRRDLIFLCFAYTGWQTNRY